MATSSTTRSAALAVAALDAGTGVALALAPRQCSALVSRGGALPPIGVVRVLGVRLAVQGLAEFARPNRFVLGGGAVANALHAASMVAAARLVPHLRRSEWTSAALATLAAALGTAAAAGRTASAVDGH